MINMTKTATKKTKVATTKPKKPTVTKVPQLL